MNFDFSEEQQLLRDSLRGFLAERYDFDRRRAAIASPDGYDPALWRALADELGVLGLAFPERAGGLDADAVSTMVVMEELGRALVIEPYLETVVICGGLLRRIGGDVADTLLARIADGRLLLAFAAADSKNRRGTASAEVRAVRDGSGWRLNGTHAVVRAAPWASHLLVSARDAGDGEGISLFVVDRASVNLVETRYRTVDGRCAADVRFDDVALPEEALLGTAGAALPLIEQVCDEAIAALSAEALGVTSRLLEDTIEYTKQRRQFGQPLASFQVLQHRMVDMYTQVEMIRTATYLATLKLDAPASERALAASAAKVAVGRACRFVGQNAVQLHGGMGVTDELTASHYFRRATVIESEFGSVDFHLMRYAELSRSAA